MICVNAPLPGDAPPIFFLRHQKENAPRPVEKKKCWCPNPAWRQVWAKTGVLARKRRIFAVWSPRWARASFFPNPPVVSPRRNVGSCPWCESNWLSLLFPLPLREPRSISVTSVPLVSPFAAAPLVVNGSCQVTSGLPSPGGKVQNRGPQPLVWSVRKGCGGTQSKGFPPGLFWIGRGPFSFSEKMGGAFPCFPVRGTPSQNIDETTPKGV